MVQFPTWIPGCDSHSPALLDLFISSQASICSLYWVILIMLLSHLPLTFHHLQIGMPCFIELLITILVVFVMLHGRISLSVVLLLLLVNFVSGFRLELMYISLVESTRSSLIHLHGFQLLVLMS